MCGLKLKFKLEKDKLQKRRSKFIPQIFSCVSSFLVISIVVVSTSLIWKLICLCQHFNVLSLHFESSLHVHCNVV